MNIAHIEQAVTTRARVRISKNNGWAASGEGIAMGYSASYDSIKVGFLDTDGNYTGDYTTVPRTMLELAEEATTQNTETNAPSPEQDQTTVQTMAANLTDEALCLAWMSTEGKPATRELALVRGWIMDELNARLGDDLFDEWLAGDDDGNSVNPLTYLVKRMIGDRENTRTAGSNFGVRTESHTRIINGRTYEFARQTWRNGRVELWAGPVGTTRGSRHRILGFAR
jgi:hypothetical protein